MTAKRIRLVSWETRLGDAEHHKQHKKFHEQATKHFHNKTFAPELVVEF